jgi:alpha-ketoglutarate-dependent taurine dioxygenase
MNTVYSPETTAIVERDLPSISDYGQLSAQLAETVREFGDANTACAALGGAGLRRLFAETSPESFATMEATRNDIRHGVGFVVLHGTGVEIAEGQADSHKDAQTSQLLSITLASVHGEPTKTDRRLAQVAWPIRFEPDSKVAVPTISQRLGEASFHTDTQYFPTPEETFGLFCVTPDVRGKGTNMLLHVDDVVAALKDAHGDEPLTQLAKFFPFKVPTVYTASGEDSEDEVTWAPILDEGDTKIRYRRDTIDNALKIPGIDLSDASIQAMNQLDQILHSLPSTDYHLEAGDGIIINNKIILHARNDFQNPKRHLWRVRTKLDQDAA